MNANKWLIQNTNTKKNYFVFENLEPFNYVQTINNNTCNHLTVCKQ